MSKKLIAFLPIWLQISWRSTTCGTLFTWRSCSWITILSRRSRAWICSSIYNGLVTSWSIYTSCRIVHKTTIQSLWPFAIKSPTNLMCMKDLFSYADLSFNNIEVLEGLNKLTKLRDLTLFNNRISRIEGMDALKELHVLSLGNNSLKQLDNVSSQWHEIWLCGF